MGACGSAQNQNVPLGGMVHRRGHSAFARYPTAANRGVRECARPECPLGRHGSQTGTFSFCALSDGGEPGRTGVRKTRMSPWAALLTDGDIQLLRAIRRRQNEACGSGQNQNVPLGGMVHRRGHSAFARYPTVANRGVRERAKPECPLGRHGSQTGTFSFCAPFDGGRTRRAGAGKTRMSPWAAWFTDGDIQLLRAIRRRQNEACGSAQNQNVPLGGTAHRRGHSGFARHTTAGNGGMRERAKPECPPGWAKETARDQRMVEREGFRAAPAGAPRSRPAQ